MGCVVSADRCGAVDWIIWNGWVRVQELLSDWGCASRWCLAVFDVCRRSLGVMCVGHALCRAMYLGWRRWGIGIAPFGRHWVGFRTLAWLQIGMRGMGLEYGLGVDHGRPDMGGGGIVFVA